MRNIKLTIEYDGTHFNGWQTQISRTKQVKHPAARKQRTIQGEIEKALKKIFKEDILLTGSGRTDSGVHALGQVANFKTSSAMSIREMQKALNANLPDDVAMTAVEDVPAGFHAQYSVKSKTYRYTVLNRSARCAQQRNFCLFYPYPLNVRAMRTEAQSLIGRHNFKSFTASDPARRRDKIKQDTVRTIKRLSITKKGNFLLFDIEANGFLYKMVRNIVGTLLEVGNGKREKGSIRRILTKQNRTTAGVTAKPKGLTLLEVKY